MVVEAGASANDEDEDIILGFAAPPIPCVSKATAEGDMVHQQLTLVDI